MNFYKFLNTNQNFSKWGSIFGEIGKAELQKEMIL